MKRGSMTVGRYRSGFRRGIGATLLAIAPLGMGFGLSAPAAATSLLEQISPTPAVYTLNTDYALSGFGATEIDVTATVYRLTGSDGVGGLSLGCSAGDYGSGVVGSIILLSRGTCLFTEKAALAQAAGAVAILVANNQVGGGAAALGGDSPSVAIGAFGLSYDLGLALAYQSLTETLVFRAARDDVATDVPEPATWTMMILGFGLAGVGLRVSRRRQFSIKPLPRQSRYPVGSDDAFSLSRLRLRPHFKKGGAMRKLLALATASLLATTASATTAIFDFDDATPATGQTSYTQTVNGITLTLSAVRDLTFDIGGSGEPGFGSNSIIGVSSGTLSNVDYRLNLSQSVRYVSFQFVSTSSGADRYELDLYPGENHGGTLTGGTEVTSPAGSADVSTIQIAQANTELQQYWFRSGVIYTSNAEAGSLFYLDNITVSTELPGQTISDVPEPASWAMMLVGFAAIGTAFRRRGAFIAHAA